MMDFGFGAFLEKFESYFGRRLSKALVAIMAVAIAVTCAAGIWSLLVEPILKIATSFSPSWASAAKVAQWLLMPLAAAAAAAVTQAILESIFQAKVASLRKDLEALRSQRLEFQQSVNDRLTIMDLAFENMLGSAAGNGLMSPEVTDLLKHLREQVGETQAIVADPHLK